MTEPNPLKASPASRRDFLKTSTAATIGLGMMTNAHAAGSDTIKVGLVGCGGRGSGAAEDICKAAGTSYNIKLHAMGDAFGDHLTNCRDRLRNHEDIKEKFDVADDRLSELVCVVKHLQGGVGSVDALPYLGPRLPAVAVGDEMVDRSFLRIDCGRSVFRGPPRREGEGASIASGAGRMLVTHR